MYVTRKFYSDPRHAWLAVKTVELTELGIADKITNYSYTKGKTTYLEEDCDASVYMHAMSFHGNSVRVVEKHTDKNHPIRSYERYMEAV
jgi:hypothetical protein